MSILTQGARAIAKNAGKIVKGIKSSGPAIVKGIKSSGVSIGKGLKSGAGAIGRGAAAAGGAATAAGTAIRNTTSAAGTAIGKGVQKVKNLFKAKPQGVVVEKIIKKGPGPPKKPVLRTRVRQGNFNSTSDPNLGLKQIEKNVKKALDKKNAVKVVKKVKPQSVKPAVVKPQKNMAYI